VKILLVLLSAILFLGNVYAQESAPECSGCSIEEVQSVAKWVQDYQGLRQFLGPNTVKVFVVEAKNSPSMVMTGYGSTDGECHLLLNRSVNLAVPDLDRKIALAHETGHCVALRLGVQTMEEGTTRKGEGFADVWALAWVQLTENSQTLHAAYERLLEMRQMSRRVDPNYNTILPVRLAGEDLIAARTLVDPIQFTLDFMRKQ
jgi:hypothetical protein